MFFRFASSDILSNRKCDCYLYVCNYGHLGLVCFQNSFDHRMKTWQKWQDAQNTLQKKREIEAKLLWANKPEKLQQAKEEITEVM